MRCPDCNKFVGYEEADAEIEDEIEVDGSAATVSANVHIVNNCSECGTELKEATLELDHEISDEALQEHLEDKNTDDVTHELNIQDHTVERTSRTEGKGRGQKTFYGAEVSFKVVCSCGGFEYEGQMSDDVQASAMDEMV